MTTHTKTNLDGLHSDVKVVQRPTKERSHDLFLRFLALSLTLVATILVGVDNQTKVISYAEMKFRASAKWEYISAMVFFVVSNAIACSYAAASLVITVMARSSGTRKSDLTDLVITALDLVLMALLFSANGAACAVGVIAQKGNKHLQWMKVCDVFDAYCRHMTAALVLSIIGSTVFLLLVLHFVLKLHYRSRS